MDKDFSMYKYFKGEKKNPFKGNDAAIWWNYEQMFDKKYQMRDCSEWNALFKFEYNAKFWALLRGESSEEKPHDKSGLFKLWLNLLICGHLMEKGGTMDDYMASYNNSAKV